MPFFAKKTWVGKSNCSSNSCSSCSYCCSYCCSLKFFSIVPCHTFFLKNCAFGSIPKQFSFGCCCSCSCGSCCSSILPCVCNIFYQTYSEWVTHGTSHYNKTHTMVQGFFMQKNHFWGPSQCSSNSCSSCSYCCSLYNVPLFIAILFHFKTIMTNA